MLEALVIYFKEIKKFLKIFIFWWWKNIFWKVNFSKVENFQNSQPNFQKLSFSKVENFEIFNFWKISLFEKIFFRHQKKIIFYDEKMFFRKVKNFKIPKFPLKILTGNFEILEFWNFHFSKKYFFIIKKWKISKTFLFPQNI